ncbi:MAG: STAS domain-containing protein [Flavobacteriales bacterium]
MEFSYKLSEQKPVVTATLSGRLMDKQSAQPLLDSLDEYIKSGSNRIILDMSGMDYMNSSGLNVLVNILTKARNQHGEVVICNLSKKIQELFLITKLNTLFQVTTDVTEAVESFKL